MQNTTIEGSHKKTFKNCHQYNINCLTVCPDNEHFLSSDDLAINMWNLENPLEAYNIVDLKPHQSQELAEVITHVEFHPRRSDYFVYSSSKGYMALCDLRTCTNFMRNSLRFN